MRKKVRKAVMLLNGAAMAALMVGVMYTMAFAHVAKQAKRNQRYGL